MSASLERVSRSVRNFGLILYPESSSYDCAFVLNALPFWFSEYAYILHDKDVDTNGELKKAHYHILARKSSPSTISVVSNQLKVPDNYIQQISNWRSSLLYLTHAGYTEKHQYPVSEVVSNLPSSYFTSAEASAFTAYIAISNFIQEGRCHSLTQLNNWCIENGYWAEFRRSWSLFSNLLHENRVRSTSFSKDDIVVAQVSHSELTGGSFADGLDKLKDNNFEQLNLEVFDNG